MRILIVLFVFLFFGCSNKNEINEMVLLKGYYIGHKRYNANIYMIKNYDKKKTLLENIEKQDTLRSFFLSIPEEEAKILIKQEKKYNKELLLAKVHIKLNDSKEYTDYRNQYHLQFFDTLSKPIYFYEIFDDYKSFKIIELYNNGLNKEGNL
ncbi:hypothetical protein NU10_07940 [Flavobacterium dauae]|uniref:hypothetical protein n=1 Tax=Flavobacterium dauae TaxID=1563479 RepID=UPI00101CD829|nr:hypothetical protein [Flavobacterium dauae]WLD22666.1 hypothetical protein NU10_07940 [Flavobacterium dauae]